VVLTQATSLLDHLKPNYVMLNRYLRNMYWKCKERARGLGVGGKWVGDRGGDD